MILANAGQEPSAAELAALVERVKAAGVKAVFSEAQFSPELAQTLADGGGHHDRRDHALHRLAGPAPADTYLGLMRWNVDQIVQALRVSATTGPIQARTRTAPADLADADVAVSVDGRVRGLRRAAGADRT